MPYEVEETGNLTRTASVTVAAETYEKKVNKALRALSGRVKIRGFRKGKIPLPVMKKRYGAAVTRDVVEELVSEKVSEVLAEMENVLFVGTPTVNNIPLDGQGELTFTIDVELRPQVDPIGYIGLEVEKPKAEISDEEVDEELENLRERHATNEPVQLRETIASGDIVTVDFQAVGDHPELAEMKGEDVQIEIGSGQALPGIDSALEGAGFDAVVESEIEVGEDFPVEEFRGGNVPIRLQVKKVERRVVPELSDDFAQKTGDGETLLELRANIRKRLLEGREKQAEEIAEKNLFEKLLEQNEIELPPLFLQEQVQRAAQRRLQMFRQQGLDPDQFGISADVIEEDIKDDVARQIREEILLMEIGKKENLEVTEEELRDFFKATAERMGVDVQQYMAFMRQNQNQMAQAQATALLDKIRTHLLASATIKDVEWPEEEEEVEAEEGSQEEEEAQASETAEEEAQEAAGEEDEESEEK